MAEPGGVLNRNVASIAKGPTLDRCSGRSLTLEQATQFLRAVEGHRHEAADVLDPSLELRKDEILGLTLHDVERTEDAVVLRIRRQLRSVVTIRKREREHARPSVRPLKRTDIAGH